MKYPVISLDECERLCARLVEGLEPDLNNAVKWVGTSPELDLKPISAMSSQLCDDLAAFQASGASDKDAFEGQASGRLHAALASLPFGVLDDPGFWRYLAISHLWPIVVWREPQAFERDWTKYRAYVDGRLPAECVPLRMFLRGQIAVVDGDYGLASAVHAGTDFWRSHIVRVRTSYSPVLAQAFIREQVADRMSTDVLRAYAKRLQRVASNVVLHTYDQEAAQTLLHSLHDDG
jgi:hypothetical protein